MIKNTLKAPKNALTHKEQSRRAQRKYFAVVLAILLFTCLALPAFASSNVALDNINKLSDFVFACIKAVGVILLGFGIVQIGMSLKGHDPAQRANGFMCFFGGLLIAFAKDILDMII